jgi:hypothetical protein
MRTLPGLLTSQPRLRSPRNGPGTLPLPPLRPGRAGRGQARSGGRITVTWTCHPHSPPWPVLERSPPPCIGLRSPGPAGAARLDLTPLHARVRSLPWGDFPGSHSELRPRPPEPRLSASPGRVLARRGSPPPAWLGSVTLCSRAPRTPPALPRARDPSLAPPREILVTPLRLPRPGSPGGTGLGSAGPGGLSWDRPSVLSALVPTPKGPAALGRLPSRAACPILIQFSGAGPPVRLTSLPVPSPFHPLTPIGTARPRE